MKHVLFPLLACALLLSACGDFDRPSVVSPGRVEVRSETFERQYATVLMDDHFLKDLAANHRRYGSGPVDIAVTYDPDGPASAATEAQKEAQRMKRVLQDKGVAVTASTLPIPSGGEDSQTFIRFPILSAQAPEACPDNMLGFDDRRTNVNINDPAVTDYGLGCTIERQFARQISKPSDLLGREGFETNADGARSTDVLNDRGYYGPRSFPPLQQKEQTQR